MSESEDAILRHAEIITEAVALSQALVDGDLQEARFRAGLVVTHSSAASMSKVASAAALVIDRLGQGDEPPSAGYGQAIQDFSVAIEEPQTLE